MRQKLTIAVALMAGLISGFILGVKIVGRVPLGERASVDWHWKRVNDYLAAMKKLPTREPYDVETSLLALNKAGEIHALELLLPTVPENRATNTYWINYLHDRPDVLLAQGLPQSSAIRFAGRQPLYLKIWCRKSTLPDIQKLVDELEALAASGKAESPNPVD